MASSSAPAHTLDRRLGPFDAAAIIVSNVIGGGILFTPPLIAAGVDPVHLGMVVVFNLMVGLLTPPMGLALYLVADIAKVTMKDVLKEMLPYYVPLLITLLLITYVPALTTWLPRLAMGGP